MAYPSVLSSLATPQPTDRLNNPSHSTLHQNENAAILEIERFVGTDSSVVGTLVNDIRSPSSNGGGHVQTANKGGTGQTSFAKGDLLVGQSSSVIGKLAVGADGAVLISDSTQAAGIRWGGGGVNVQSFISDGVWLKPSALGVNSKVFVELWAGGGSGGAAVGADEAGGGGGGGYMAAFYPASVLSTSVLVGVGIGGPASGANNIGQSGTFTVFNTQASLLTAYPGAGGTISTPGAGGGGGGGTFNAGSQATGQNGGGGGSVYGGNGGAANAVGVNGQYIGLAGGGGGGGGDGQNGGFSAFGGGGGGGARSSLLGLGGVSGVGGNGRAGSVLTNASIAAAFVPGGGGGAAYGNGCSSGPGGAGKILITTFIT